MADPLDPATMDALNQLGAEIEAEAGTTPPASPQNGAGAEDPPAPQDEAGQVEDRAPEAPEGTEPASEGEGEPEGDGDGQPPKKPAQKRAGVEKDVQRLLRERYEARNQRDEERARREAAERRLAELEAAQQRQPEATPQPGQAAAQPVVQRQGESGQDFEARVQAEAKRLNEAAAFNEACNRVASKGIEAHKDFGEAQGALMGAFGRQVNARPEFLQAIVRLENGHDVFHYLGTNLEAAETVFAQANPVDLVLAIKDLSAKLKTPKSPKLSNAPAPVTPIRGSGTGRQAARLDDDKLPDEDYKSALFKSMAS